MAVSFGLLVRAGWGEDSWRAVRWVVGAVAAIQACLFVGSRLLNLAAPLLLPGNAQYGAFWILAALLWPAGEAASGKLPFLRRRCWFRWAVSLLFLAGIVFSGVRSALMGLAVGGAWLLWRRWRFRGLLWGAVGLAAFAAATPRPAWYQALKIGDAAAWKRTDIWTAALSGIRARPWLGWGPGQFESLYRLHAVPQDEGGLRFDHSTLFAHNDFLQMAAGAGLPALAALGWAMVILLRAAWRERNPIGPVLAGGTVFAFFNFPFALPVNTLLAGGAAALAPARIQDTYPRVARALRRALALFLAFVSAATALELPTVFLAGPPERVFYGRSAAYLEMGEILLRHEMLLLSGREGEALIEKALWLCPGRAENWQAWATVLARRGRMEEAVRALSEALRRHPKNSVWWADLGLWRLNAGDLSAAAGSFHEALRAEPRCFAAALFLGRTIRLRGDPEKALRWLTRLQEGPSGIAPDPAFLSPYARAVLSRDEPGLRGEIEECRKDIIRRK